MSGRAAGLILAAGRSRRFGSDKLAVVLAGKPLLQHVLDAATAAGLAPLVVVLARPPVGLAWGGAHWVVNPDPERGLSSSLQVGLARLGAEDAVERVAVLLGDQPLVSPLVIRRLLTERPVAGQPIVVPLYAGGQPGNPVILDRPAWPLAAQLIGDRGMVQLFAARPELVRYIDVPGTNPDIDTPGDLAALEGRPTRA